MGLAKVPAIGYYGGYEWDHAGRTQIAQILVSYERDSLKSLQFTYLGDNGKLHTSEIIGPADHNAYLLDVITFKGGGEYVTKVEGLYDQGCYSFKKLSIETNRQVYNVFVAEGDLTEYKKFRFNFGGLNQFGGFHGSMNISSKEIASIGVYFSHLQALPPNFECSFKQEP